MNNKIPAKKAMLYYFTNFTSEKEQGFQGRQRVTLPVLIDEELKFMYEAACKMHNKRSSRKVSEQDARAAQDASRLSTFGESSQKKSDVEKDHSEYT